MVYAVLEFHKHVGNEASFRWEESPFFLSIPREKIHRKLSIYDQYA